MTIQLLESINIFFEVSNGIGLGRVKTCFTQDAVVLDEGCSHQGLAAIESWAHDTRQKYEFSVKPRVSPSKTAMIWSLQKSAAISRAAL
ncbi:hypothetical protein Q9252_00075 [Marinobacter salarius]|uniref:hypothetical protein n=1 Tax=Marinobacter salarius TaxID=1420917 RepID=UPI00273CE008|nr:hypothetical protein [Marinobacter salarius]MDP4530512.1 hypothetical protein [Marinobacter salarius]